MKVRMQMAISVDVDLTVNKEEEGSSLVGHGPSDEGFPRTRRSIEEDTSWWLHSNGLEQLRMT